MLVHIPPSRKPTQNKRPKIKHTVADYKKKVMSTKLSFSCYSTFQYYASICMARCWMFEVYKKGYLHMEENLLS